MSLLYGLIFAVIVFVVLNLFLPAGWAFAAALVVFFLSIMGYGNGRRY